MLDFGSPYTQLIARRVRELRVYSEILPWNTTAANLAQRKPVGIILSGGPAGVFEPNAPACDPALFDLGIPILGICYGMQLTAKTLGGKVKLGQAPEYGPARISVIEADTLFQDLPVYLDAWMSHGDQVEAMPDGFIRLARTDACPIAAMAHPARKIFGLQFHPEAAHTPHGADILRRFIFTACGAQANWRMTGFIQQSIETVRRKVGKEHVVCGLSGGVDSSVTAVLLQKAIGRQLHCIFVDNGLMRAGETDQVKATFGERFGIDLHAVAAGEQFLADLQGVLDPEEKRKRIGKRFIDIFAAESRRLGNIRFLAQGTLYPDVIESVVPPGGSSVAIKSHHNVGGLPPDLEFELIEPLRELFKDEVRALGRELGLPDVIINRQPFPGPGLAVRIVGEVTATRVALLQQADLRVQEEMEKYDRRHELWQWFTVLLPVFSVGVMGGERTYENAAVLRAVTSQDGMTAEWAHLPADLLARISNRIINEVRGINRVVYDISSKPPATIEWE